MTTARPLERVITADLPRLGRFDPTTLDKAWRLLTLFPMSGRLSYEKLTGALSISKSTLASLLNALERSGVLNKVLPYGAEYGRQARMDSIYEPGART